MTELVRGSALDLASTSGLAFGSLGEIPQARTWKLGAEGRKSRGERGLELMRLLLAHLEEYKPEIVFIEAPLPPAVLMEIGSSADTAVILPGFVLVAETVCASRSIESRTLNRQEVLKHFTGQSRFRGKDEAKKACLARCVQLGWKPDGYDQADAIALLDFGLCALTSRSAQLMANRPRFR